MLLRIEGGQRQLLQRVARGLREEIRDEERPRLQRLLKAAREHGVPAVLDTEEVSLEFDESGVRRLAEVAFQVNENTENIGARRLHTVMERLLETISFEASDKSGTQLKIDAAYVDDHLAELSTDEDLSRYIL